MQIKKIEFGDAKYRSAYVVQPAHDYSALQKHCDRIKFMTSGYEDATTAMQRFEDELKDFDPKIDCIVPSGKTFFNIILGMILVSNLIRSTIILALFSRDNGYTFYEVSNGH